MAGVSPPLLTRVAQLEINEHAIEGFGRNARTRMAGFVDGPESEQLDERSDHQPDFELPKMLAGTHPGAMSKPEVKNLFRSPCLQCNTLPAFGNELVGRMPGEGHSPVILVAVGVPDVQQNVRSVGNHQALSVSRLDPRVPRGTSRQKVQRGGQAQRLVEHMIESTWRPQIFGRIKLNMLDLLKHLS